MTGAVLRKNTYADVRFSAATPGHFPIAAGEVVERVRSDAD
jgi:hypothetical protein